MIRRRFPLALLVLALLVLPSPRFAHAQLSEQEERGKQIYLTGTSPSGHEITALMGGEGGVEVPAGALPCVNCHGADGRGVPEGGVERRVEWVPGTVCLVLRPTVAWAFACATISAPWSDRLPVSNKS